MGFRLLTINLHTYQEHQCWSLWETVKAHDREARIISEAIAQQEVDIVCFQEVGESIYESITTPYGTTHSNMAYRIFLRLQSRGLHYNLFQDWSHVGFGIWREGTAILSKHPMYHNYSMYVSHNQNKDHFMSRNVTTSCIDVPRFGLLHVVNAHLNRAEHGGKEEFDAIRHLADSREHFGVRGGVLVGDFNTLPGTDAYHHMVYSTEYIDQWYEVAPHNFYEPTHRGKIAGWEHSDPARIDYIFKKNGSPLQIESIQLIFNNHFFPIVSDHYGYLATFDTY
ncbi:MAG: endonuclease/exonuclease/phosphatase family protein [SAR324 cluster bacterium]|nr:endonuclease/exonuclease/phosphatase family protein [SAR324 cluster bacterium]